MSKIVTRFAPSPTGYLHIGGLRTALFNYLYARANNGKFLLRIEDTDLARNSLDATKAIIEGFEWVGLDYDGEVVYQSKRFQLYSEFVEKLLKEGKAYYCYMSKEELEAERKKAEEKGQVWKYDNRYRDFSGTPPSDIKPVVRIKAPLDGEICFSDGVKGEMKISAKELDDFIIARSDGSPTYNFVVAIDDALMGVTDVIRGDDHLSNTPKQIVVYNALNFKIPRFFHVPMILNEKGQKLSKRDGAMSVMEYKELGFLPESLLNFLVRLGWSYGDKEIFSIKEMLELFNPQNLNTSPSAYNTTKLKWLNAHYIKEASNEKINSLLGFYGGKIPSEHVQNALYSEIKDRSESMLDFVRILNECLNAPQEFDEKFKKKVATQANIENLKSLYEFLSNFKSDFSNQKESEEFLESFTKQSGVESKTLFMPLRYALLGKSGGVGIIALLSALGKNEVILRLKNALVSLES